MQAVDVLGHHGQELPFLLPAGQDLVGDVGLEVQGEHLLPVKAEEILRPALVKAVGNDRFGRIFELLVIQAVHAAEVRDAGLGGHARAAEEYDPPGFIDPLFECFDF